MAASNPSLQPEIGPDGLSREAPVIAYTEKIIEEEQHQLRKYIEENYSKIRDVERELANLTMEIKLTAGPKKAAMELLRKKIEMSTERIHLAKQKEEQARKVWEAASKAVQEEEAMKQKLCEDLNSLVQESSNTQFSRLEELKRRLEALNPTRASISSLQDGKPMAPVQISTAPDTSSVSSAVEPGAGITQNASSNQGNGGNAPIMNGNNQQATVDGEGRGKKKTHFPGRGKGVGALPKGRGSTAPGWTGAGFDVDGRA
ncbi:uncharacterized protein LOC116121902 [Pistacia vera]|uniref:uncharacterized protein LOC116121902 n=1 Tax=Pistacia vera TaxID=55513 RepID=UPI001263A354|nr:uncharacterized protein LOC116121902 [Pistacia vera]XP_031263667.1 uncharacterized protein LOC116121902 [Pistacia vera]